MRMWPVPIALALPLLRQEGQFSLEVFAYEYNLYDVPEPVIHL